LFKVAATGAATDKSKGYARVIDAANIKYFQYLSKIKKI
jgi:hypothetical protein